MQFPLNDLDRRLAALFPAGQAFANGGRVRDYFVDLFHGTTTASKDFDYVLTGMTAEHAAAQLRALGPVTLAGACFPVFKVNVGNKTLDVALARKERSTGVGHRDFEVDFGIEVSVEEDARRRDFTMNMLSVDLSTGEVRAPARALEDIERGVIRAISEHSFVEDPLRMERAVQFASRLGFAIEPQTLRWITANRSLVESVSPERHNEELVKILTRSPMPSQGFRLMAETGILPFIVPELAEGIGFVQNRYHEHDVWGHNLAALDVSARTNGDLVDRLAAVFHDVGKPRSAQARPDGLGHSFHGHEIVGAEMVSDILGRLHFSNDQIEDVTLLVGLHMYATRGSGGTDLTDATIRRFIRAASRETENRDVARRRIERQFALRFCDRIGSGRPPEDRQADNAIFEQRVWDQFAQQLALTVGHLEIDGRDIIRTAVSVGARPAGYRGDRLVGDTLRALLDAVTEDPPLNERSRLLAAAHTIVADHAQHVSPSRATNTLSR